MTQGGVKRAQPLLMAAGSDNAAGKLPVAMISSFLDTVVVTRRRRRVTSLRFLTHIRPALWLRSRCPRCTMPTQMSFAMIPMLRGP